MGDAWVMHVVANKYLGHDGVSQLDLRQGAERYGPEFTAGYAPFLSTREMVVYRPAADPRGLWKRAMRSWAGARLIFVGERLRGMPPATNTEQLPNAANPS